ncbi:DUF1176 domain-containing protein [Acinetobacter pittii]|uniref:DUF1176 domain-containing protein n=1 Tax=Acinetobacter pittii TaxID=48296 RepID=UPI002A09C5EF|nr:DUF1176 domain-containing protein [Acinetobacter pittii]MDX8254810.1 DUF1176 domain-containing protein [Acinetobacter pittii]
MKKILSICCLVALSSYGFAQDIKGISFSHQEWEISCSNTGTCKAAGYQNEENGDNPASLLLVRKAGPKQAVQAEFALSDCEQSLPANQLKNIHFYINGKDLGAVVADGAELPLMGKLNSPQVNTLLQQSKQKTEIVFKNAQHEWKVSDAGMTAVLLKMDDFQKRIGTVGALVKKGSANETKVLMPEPKLLVKRIKTSNKPYLTLQSKSKQYQAIHRSLMAANPNPKEDFCEGIYSGNSDGAEPQKIELYKLTNKRVLATTLCWRGAYNEGYGAWVFDESLTGKAMFVTESASDFDSGIISSAQKGRGIGDCWASEEWVWDGKSFVHIKDMWTGMCKGLVAGGVWELDRIESVVK